MRIKKVNSDYEIKPFDCGDADLNGFLLNDAKSYAEKKIAYTFVFENDEGDIIAYYSLLNDKVTKMEASNAAWRKVKKLFPHNKHFGSYPSIKIGRFAVDKRFRSQGFGHKLMKILKDALAHKDTDSAFRFLTVDAYLSAVPFYVRNGFLPLTSDDDDQHTRLMYYDMMEM